jgi:hypothetical protein
MIVTDIMCESAVQINSSITVFSKDMMSCMYGCYGYFLSNYYFMNYAYSTFLIRESHTSIVCSQLETRCLTCCWPHLLLLVLLRSVTSCCLC